MDNQWALQDAKNRFSKLVQCAIEQGPQTVTRNGRKAVVVIAADEYSRLARRQGSLVEFMRASPLAGLDLDVSRSQDLGRRVRL